MKNVCLLLKKIFVLITIILVYSIFAPPLYSHGTFDEKTTWRESAVKVFLDMPSRRYWNYVEYIKTEISFVNYVRDRKQAQVHVMLTTRRTGSNGTEYTIIFLGQQNFSGKNDTLKYVSKQTDTEDITRKGIVRVLKMGLMPYVARTPLANSIFISCRNKAKPTAVIDKWDSWVFSINTNIHLDGEEATKSFSIRGSFSADRVTDNYKISLNAGTNYWQNKFRSEDYQYSIFSKSQTLRGLIVKSLNQHWSAGLYGSVNSSTYTNTKLSLSTAPAVEYDIFPYSESMWREFRILYRIGYTNIHYNEETIFNKIREKLFNENLSVTIGIKQKWGSMSFTLEGSHYFHDFSKNRLQLFNNFSLHLFEGLSFTMRGKVSMIHDQLSLPKEDATQEEILLHQKQLATQYKYFVATGLRYTFGSIYNNVVNPRFGE